MKISVTYQGHPYMCDLQHPMDISIPIGQVRCFYAAPYQAQPFESGDFTGSVAAGAPVNFFRVSLNPHGHGTHTESLGHITEEQETIHQTLTTFHFVARLISIPVEKKENGDQVITREALERVGEANYPEALILRTLPNEPSKLNKDYSGTNPPYLTQEAMQYIVLQGVQHFLLDLPSVDKESDGGLLTAHREFWQLSHDMEKEAIRKKCTITELIYVPDDIPDGLYLLNLQIPSLLLDAAPSKPVLYKLVTQTNEMTD